MRKDNRLPDPPAECFELCESRMGPRVGLERFRDDCHKGDIMDTMT